jgi:prepilin-type N-terminal cleavage/methylation domain-containing protein
MTSRSAGFSLIELIIVIVVVAIAAVAIGSAFAYISRSQRLGVDLQSATQIAQECAAHVVGLGRKPGSYAAVVPVASPSTICNALPAINPAFTRVVNVTTMPTGGALCSAGPPAWACKRIEIIVTRGGSGLVTLNFMLVNY